MTIESPCVICQLQIVQQIIGLATLQLAELADRVSSAGDDDGLSEALRDRTDALISEHWALDAIIKTQAELEAIDADMPSR